MRIWLIIEGRHLDIAAAAVQRLGFLQGPIGLQSEGLQSPFAGERFQCAEDAPTDAEPARIPADPHALYFADVSILYLERATTDRLAAQARNHKGADWRRDLVHIRRDGVCRVETALEARGELAKIGVETETRIGAIRRLDRYLHSGCLHQPLHLRHGGGQSVPLAAAQGN